MKRKRKDAKCRRSQAASSLMGRMRDGALQMCGKQVFVNRESSECGDAVKQPEEIHTLTTYITSSRLHIRSSCCSRCRCRCRLVLARVHVKETCFIVCQRWWMHFLTALQKNRKIPHACLINDITEHAHTGERIYICTCTTYVLIIREKDLSNNVHG